ncbi:OXIDOREDUCTASE 2OG-FE II OXYGENASE FAMILY PROTEIN [Salix purpurea]|uniref:OXIDOREDUCTASE 2OG-FE II OXYGENASE FAMILY PROTEIN n=1 Tax=Salix purpurea TaxID=77065 RepID=A0A9Q0TX53_SALPP|nr:OXIDOREDUCTASE 2OG-FE II OXYGENASE FAMILY PROTEIN [Salix purpurea]
MAARRIQEENDSDYDRQSELRAFDDTKAGVKGLVDAGVTKIPRIFIQEQCAKVDDSPASIEPNFSIPIIDIEGWDGDENRRHNIVEKIGGACKKWGFFQVVNHGIPRNVLEDMIDGIHRFHHQDVEVKKAASWRDTLTCVMAPNPPNPEEFPPICRHRLTSVDRYRDILVDYAKRVMALGITLFGLLSEALGLEPNHLEDIGCAEGLYVLGHCYPACPEPELAMGTRKHADSGFLTLLLQDQIGGLQVLHENQWVNVTPAPGSLVLISNDIFTSVHHRVLAKNIGPRISVACIFRQPLLPETLRMYGPIKELLSEENPPVYREITVKEFMALRILTGYDVLRHLKLRS